MSGIKDRIVAATGSSSEIGEAIALELASRGAAVVLGARRAVTPARPAPSASGHQGTGGAAPRRHRRHQGRVERDW